jgi:hypothetical protein
MDNGKHTAPVVMGLESARQRADELQDRASAAIDEFGDDAGSLRYLIQRLTWAPV